MRMEGIATPRKEELGPCRHPHLFCTSPRPPPRPLQSQSGASNPTVWCSLCWYPPCGLWCSCLSAWHPGLSATCWTCPTPGWTSKCAQRVSLCVERGRTEWHPGAALHSCLSLLCRKPVWGGTVHTLSAWSPQGPARHAWAGQQDPSYPGVCWEGKCWSGGCLLGPRARV